MARLGDRTKDARRAPGRSRLRAVEFIATNLSVVSILVVFMVLFFYFSVQANAFLTAENLVNVGRCLLYTSPSPRDS